GSVLPLLGVGLGTTIHPLIWRLSSDQWERIHGVRRVRMPVSGRRDTWTDEQTAGFAQCRSACPLSAKPGAFKRCRTRRSQPSDIDIHVFIFLSVSGCMHGLRRV